ncbi:MAG: hypothetical protein NZ528_12490 [Caldilineales bacterium]|nr:hypothetical protein [Caldilineales bacterium]MDW8318747.1 hypothetical protein [Anaerolineae bacterium]
MTTDDIRARIAEIEAEAERRNGANRGASRQDDDPWNLLFDAALLGGLAADGEDSFSWRAWLSEGLRGLRGYLRRQGLDDEVVAHLRTAERELLLAARALIDHRLERVEARNHQAEQAGRRHEIEVEWNDQ